MCNNKVPVIRYRCDESNPLFGMNGQCVLNRYKAFGWDKKCASVVRAGGFYFQVGTSMWSDMKITRKRKSLVLAVVEMMLILVYILENRSLYRHSVITVYPYYTVNSDYYTIWHNTMIQCVLVYKSYFINHIHSSERSSKWHPAVHQKWKLAQGSLLQADSPQQGRTTETMLNWRCVYTLVWEHYLRCGSTAGHSCDEHVESAALTCRSEEDVIVCPSVHWNIIIHLLFLWFLITIPVGLQLSPGIDCWHLVFSVFFVIMFILTLKKKISFHVKSLVVLQQAVFFFFFF